MVLPQGSDYYNAVQTPQLAFKDPELKASSVGLTPQGMPRPYSGGFATTFRFASGGGQAWAVRCFLKNVPGVQVRYEALKIIKTNPALNQYFINATYYEQGINVNGKWFPIIKMPWIEASTLGSFIEKNKSSAAIVKKVRDDFITMVVALEQARVAHGDLQQGNILIDSQNRLKLIDYDSLLTPQIAQQLSGSVVFGKDDYVHPDKKENDYNLEVDRFPSIVIYLGLLATEYNPTLWDQYCNNDNVLFKRDDFAAPRNSPLIKALHADTRLATVANDFCAVCEAPYREIPSLADFIARRNIPTTKRPVLVLVKSSSTTPVQQPAAQHVQQTPLVNASSLSVLLQYVGHYIEVIGVVSKTQNGWTKYRTPYIFVNFGGDWPNHTFTAILWSEGLKAIEHSTTISVNQIRAGAYVSVKGVVVQYKGKPQIEVTKVSQIKVLTQAEYQRRLGGMPSISTTSPRPVTLPPPGLSRITTPTHSSRLPPPGHSRSTNTQGTAQQSQRADSSSWCFIATVVYGNVNAPEVRALRTYRDTVLSTNVWGRKLIQFYYKTGPYAAKLITKAPVLKQITKSFLDRVVKHINSSWRE